MQIKFAAVLALGLVCLAVVAEARVVVSEENEVDKRFILDTLQKIGETFGHLTLAELIEVYKSAEAKFLSVFGSKAQFLHAVDELEKKIHSDTTVSGCTSICMTGASTLLPHLPSGQDAQPVCKEVCDAALAKVEELARGKSD